MQQIHHDGDGKTTAKPDVVTKLTQEAWRRARIRGSTILSPRDVADAARFIEEQLRHPQGDLSRATFPVAPSRPAPAAVLPDNYNELCSSLRRIRDIVERRQGAGHPPPRDLITEECSGVVASMFLLTGADVATCDFQDTETPHIPHFRGNADLIQDLGWDLVIAHPPCTYLSNVGV